MRCADLGPMPGRRPSSSMSERMGPVYILARAPRSLPGRPARGSRASASEAWSRSPWSRPRDSAGSTLVVPASRSGRLQQAGLGGWRRAAPTARPLRPARAGSGTGGAARRHRLGRAALSSISRTSVIGVPKCSASRGLDRGHLLGALVAVRRVGQREVRALLVDGHEAAAGEARLGPRRQRTGGCRRPRPRSGCRGRRSSSPSPRPPPGVGAVAARAAGRLDLRAGASAGGGGRAGLVCGERSVRRRLGRAGAGAVASAAASLPLDRAERRTGADRACRGAGRSGRRPDAVDDAGAAASRPPPAGHRAGGRPPRPTSDRSSTLMRSESASVPESRSGRTARTAAISSTTCASGASRMSTSAWPRISMLRTTRARPIVSASARNALERRPRDGAQLGGQRGEEDLAQVVDELGRQLLGAPAAGEQRARARRGPPLTSPSASASSTWASSGRAASVDPDATTWSRADRASRAEPRPRRTAASSASSPSWRPASALTDSSRACSVSAPRRRNSRCWVRLRMVGGHLLGVGGGQHEDDVARRLLERLEQRVGRRRREHVHLVDDVDLPAPRRPQPGVGHQVAHGVDAVVGGGIELVHVERAALGDLDARACTRRRAHRRPAPRS